MEQMPVDARSFSIRKRVNLIATGRGRELANGEPGQNWGLQHVILWRPLDLLFEMHDLEKMLKYHPDPDKRNAIKQSLEKARVQNIPVISINDFEGSQCYPFEKIVAAFGTKYFSCTVSYMIALAVYRGFKDIHLFGINGVDGHNFTRPGIEFWLGIAIGRGCRVYVHGSMYSKILRTENNLLYGYQYPTWGNNAEKK